jgi:hypothetical protein
VLLHEALEQFQGAAAHIAAPPAGPPTSSLIDTPIASREILRFTASHTQGKQRQIQTANVAAPARAAADLIDAAALQQALFKGAEEPGALANHLPPPLPPPRARWPAS